MRPSTSTCTRHALILGSAALCLAGLALDLSAQDVVVSENVRAGGIDSLQRDEPGSRIHRSRAVALLASSMDQVTAVVTDYGSYYQFMPNFVASRILSMRGHNALVYAEVSALDGMASLWVQMQLRMLDTTTTTRVIRAKMMKGNLQGFEAEWQVTPVDATHTFVAFELCANPKFKLPFGDGLISDYNETKARASIEGLRRELLRRSQQQSTKAALR